MNTPSHIMILVLLLTLLVSNCAFSQQKSDEDIIKEQNVQLDAIQNMLAVDLKELTINGTFSKISDSSFYKKATDSVNEKMDKATGLAGTILKRTNGEGLDKFCDFFQISVSLETVLTSLKDIKQCLNKNCQRDDLDTETKIFNKKVTNLASQVDQCRASLNKM